MVVTSAALVLPREVPGTGADVMIDPPAPTRTLSTAEVVVTAEPWALVETRTTAGNREDVVMVEP